MKSAGRQRAFGAWTGWWAIAARALALVLALAVALPTAGLAEDLAYHQNHPGHDRTELVMASDLTPASARAADPGIACHVHCGCHVAMPSDGLAPVPPALPSRPCYAPVDAACASISPDRLPRPPRA
ncbi:hypothetical protein MCBMB27_01100 [Methylobacterium phyllosphaerae]|uniref:DUF2946 domain-containing protein n=1 Tax=Methylobacterium phyllosphaerae TaxID=418223 RepID=A0AAE8HP92_9HYPH|nr:hypothetical protein [Methylobacterium phyllosphaerae]APT30391.1 hypothetical protein MCBMB27_01100 [Methylobacterium phyllosphaerae]SFG48958.1 hypothetical protein SAMN05192567_10459 [Methylobacterium phyllosphaerae]